jgi:histone H3/H4
MSEVANLWKKCSACKKPILLGSQYYECSVSTCSSERTGYVFCSVGCWEAHIPGANHRSSAGAIEKYAPKTLEARRIILTAHSAAASGGSASTAARKSSSMSHEVLVVVSKMKQYIRDTSDFNTSEDVNQVLSNMVRIACDRAVEKAKAQGRKTVMAKDFSF